MEKERFSLLLLEPNEIYFEDFSVNLINDNACNKDEEPVSGHLKMCSKSIVFDPKDVKLPMIKIAYKNCDEISVWPGNIGRSESNVLSVVCSQYAEMLPKNIVAPYTFRNETREFLFNFHYAQVEDYINQLCQLHRASNLHAIEQNDMIAAFVYSRHKRVKFNPLWLDDIYENVLVDFTVDEIHPLVLNPGRLLLSSRRIYFQPYNNIQPYPVIKINLQDIYSLVKRRFLLRQIGFEIKWNENGKEHMLYVSFRSPNERNDFHAKLVQHEKVQIKQMEPESMTLKWQNGIISNYDYLVYLNSLADRTFQDLTQYPVFPWIISDYESSEIDLDDPRIYRDLSKPIGALNEERLERLQERFEEMDEPKFLYGSHYSAPALVLFYLVRKHPKLMLCLQNGHFDHPDRMFNRVSDAFRNCLNNMADFKELIPEFYDVNSGGDFMLNEQNINFGRRFDGTAVNNVTLPLWAKGSPEIFVKTLREALESEHVSKNLHHWIDLIFGYKQRGAEAVKANNLFFHLCYEGAIDLENINELAKRHAYEVQISEFGQIPKQLFMKPHVQRIVPIPSISRVLSTLERESSVELDADEKEEGANRPDFTNLKYEASFQSHKNLICSVAVEGDLVVSTGKDGLLKCYNAKERKQTRSVPISNLPISSCIKLPNSNSFVLGSWDNSIIIFDSDYGRRSNEIPAHDDAVSCLRYLSDIDLLVSGSWDGSVKIWKGFQSKSYCLSESLISYVSAEDKVVAIDARKCDAVIKVVIGLANREVMLWTSSFAFANEVNEIETIESKTLYAHRDEVTDVSFNGNGSKIVSCGLDRKLFVCDTDTGMILFQKEDSDPLICLSWCWDNEILYAGDKVGFIHVWNMMNGEKLRDEEVFDGPVTAITSVMNEDGCKVVAGGVDRNEFLIKQWKSE